MRAVAFTMIFGAITFCFGANNMVQNFQGCSVKLQKALQANLKTLGYSLNLPISDENVSENVAVILEQIHNFCEYMYLDKALSRQDGRELEDDFVSRLLRRDLEKVGTFFKDGSANDDDAF